MMNDSNTPQYPKVSSINVNHSFLELMEAANGNGGPIRALLH